MPTVDGQMAFVPSPLPPNWRRTAATDRLLSEADLALGRLSGVGLNMANPHLLIRPFMRREAVLSSRIEGTQADIPDVYLFEVDPARQTNVPDSREVANYVRALEHGMSRLGELPLSLRLLREIHEKLLEGVRGRDQTPGEFRRLQNWIGPEGSPIEQAVYVPPPPPQMHEAMAQLERFLHQPSDLPPLVRLAVIHYQFEAIHPFVDGNGRIGRLLITLMLCHERVLPQPLLYLSAFFEQHRRDYYRRLLEVSTRGDWDAWIEFFLRGVREQSADAVDRARRLLDLRDEFFRRLQQKGATVLTTRVVDELFVIPIVTIPRVADKLGVQYPSAKNIVVRLVDAGILKPLTPQRKRNRLFWAEEIIDVIR